MKDEVSVITTSMNYGRYIEECIKSVLGQKAGFPFRMNHIIMDGGSTDDTVQRLEKYEGQVHFYMNRGEGQTAALNHAMNVIESHFPRTNVVGWLNADDLYKPHWLNVSLSVLRDEPKDVSMTCGRFSQIGVPENLKEKVARMEAREAVTEVIPYVDVRKLVKGNLICQPTVLIRMSAFKILKKRYGYYFDPKLNYCQDVDLWLRFLLNGYRIRRLSSRVATLRRHPKRLTNKFRRQQRNEGILVRQKAANKLGVKRNPRIAFIWHVLGSHKDGFWENKRDSMQNAIASLSIWHDIRVFVSTEKQKKRQIIQGQDITFYGYHSPKQLLNCLKAFNPKMIFMNIVGDPLWLKVIEEFPDAWKALVDYGSKKMKIPRPTEIDKVIVQQAYQKKMFLERNEVQPVKIGVNPFCIDVDHFKPKPMGKLYTGVMLADFRKEIKRQHLLIRAWKQIPGRLLLIGRFERSIPSTFHEDCMKLASNLKIRNKVTFMDGCSREQLPNIINTAKIAYLTSSREGGSRALLEKMSCGLPALVMRDCPGSVYLINNGVDGRVAYPNPRDIAAKTLSVLENYRKMGTAASERIRREHHYGRMFSFYRNLIHEFKVRDDF